VTAGPGDVEPTGWRLVRDLVTEFWREMRAGAQPLPVLYLLCDGCGNVTPRTSVRKSFSVANGEVSGGTPESVCAACDYAQPRVVDDEVPADTTIVCTGHQFRRFGFIRRRRRTCGENFAVSAMATLVICPWCMTEQPGPAA
jgi:hypothetical protein